ncbi:hypothetical protein [Streptomyces sp. NPDC005969]|uniref:hypothetical protein n=1 Tax=Streptomyces sp. NPDC005969 TaxID=3156722 RepID=UPI0033DF5558
MPADLRRRTGTLVSALAIGLVALFTPTTAFAASHPVGKGWVAKSPGDVPCKDISVGHSASIYCVNKHGGWSKGYLSLRKGAVTKIGRVSFKYSGHYKSTYWIYSLYVDGKRAVPPGGYANEIALNSSSKSEGWTLRM